MGLLKWLVVFFILAIIALLVLPVPVLHGIFSFIGSVSSKLYIPLPKLKDRKELFKYYTKNMPISHLDYLKLGLRSFFFWLLDFLFLCFLFLDGFVQVWLLGLK